jgi:hypothetical protein
MHHDLIGTQREDGPGALSGAGYKNTQPVAVLTQNVDDARRRESVSPTCIQEEINQRLMPESLQVLKEHGDGVLPYLPPKVGPISCDVRDDLATS